MGYYSFLPCEWSWLKCLLESRPVAVSARNGVTAPSDTAVLRHYERVRVLTHAGLSIRRHSRPCPRHWSVYLVCIAWLRRAVIWREGSSVFAPVYNREPVIIILFYGNAAATPRLLLESDVLCVPNVRGFIFGMTGVPPAAFLSSLYRCQRSPPAQFMSSSKMDVDHFKCKSMFCFLPSSII